DLVVPPVVRRVDDALVLPSAPWMRPGGCEGDAELICKLRELRTTLGHPLRRLAEARAPSRLDLDLGGDQLADEVLVELRSGGAGLELLEAIRKLERLRIEERELLLH